MPKSVQTTAQLHSFHMLSRQCSKSFSPGFSSTWTENYRMCKKQQRNERSNHQNPLNPRKSKEVQKNLYFCFIDYAKAFYCVDHNKLENSSWDGKTRPPNLPFEKPVCRSRSNTWNRPWNNRLVPNWERSMSRFYTVTLLT